MRSLQSVCTLPATKGVEGLICRGIALRTFDPSWPQGPEDGGLLPFELMASASGNPDPTSPALHTLDPCRDAAPDCEAEHPTCSK